MTNKIGKKVRSAQLSPSPQLWRQLYLLVDKLTTTTICQFIMTVVIYYYQFCFQRATRENTFYSNWCHPLKIKVIINNISEWCSNMQRDFERQEEKKITEFALLMNSLLCEAAFLIKTSGFIKAQGLSHFVNVSLQRFVLIMQPSQCFQSSFPLCFRLFDSVFHLKG